MFMKVLIQKVNVDHEKPICSATFFFPKVASTSMTIAIAACCNNIALVNQRMTVNQQNKNFSNVNAKFEAFIIIHNLYYFIICYNDFLLSNSVSSAHCLTKVMKLVCSDYKQRQISHTPKPADHYEDSNLIQK